MARPTNRSDRPTKAQRKDQARLERERIRQQMARRRRMRFVSIGIVVLAIAGTIAAGLLLRDTLPSPDSLLEDARSQAQSAGCGDLEQVPPFDPPDLDRAHINGVDVQMPPLSAYPSIPPASGPHNDQTLRFGVYSTPPPIDQAIHSLEHAGAIVWLSPDVPQDEFDEIARFYERTDVPVGATKVIVAVWDYPAEGDAGALPNGAQMALVAWHRRQLCASASLAVAYDFTSRYSTGPNDAGLPYQGEAPEPQGSL